MNGRVFVATNILVYAHDHTAGRKHDEARSLTQRLWNSEKGVISTQVLQELYAALRRKSTVPLSVQEAERILKDYFMWEIVVNTRESVLRAISLETRYKISFWDGLILQAAERAGADLMYSEDLSHGQIYGNVKVLNPFTDS